MHRLADVAVVDPDGRVLLQERDEHATTRPGRWGLPGGDLESGETSTEAAVRELAEETGLRASGEELVSLGGATYHSEPCGHLDAFELFVLHADVGDAGVSCGEGRRMVFVEPGDLFDRPLHPAAAMQLPDLLDSAGYRERFGTVPSRRFASVALVGPNGALLMQERDEHPVLDPGRWGLPGGHLADGEAFLDGALRELAEETGVVLERDAVTLVGEARVDHTDVYGTHDRVRFFAAATALGDDGVECREGRQMVFVDPASVTDLPLTRSARALVPGFLRSGLYARLTT